jgi:hypothetical protein
MGDQWEIMVWAPVEEESTFYENKQIASGNGGWEEMQEALYLAHERERENNRPITMVWRGDTIA